MRSFRKQSADDWGLGTYGVKTGSLSARRVRIDTAINVGSDRIVRKYAINLPPTSTLKTLLPQLPRKEKCTAKDVILHPILICPTVPLNCLQSEHDRHSTNHHQSSRLSGQTRSGASERRWRGRRGHGCVGGRERGARRRGLDLAVTDLGDNGGGSGDAGLAVGELGGNRGDGADGRHAAGHGHGH